MKIDAQALARIVAETLDVPSREIHSDSKSEDFPQWDSLAHLRVCMAVEESFGVTIKMEKIPELDSMPKLQAFLENR